MSTFYKHGDRVPSVILANRLDQLSEAARKRGEDFDREFTMRVPAELDRDADLVLSEAANRIRETEAKLAAIGRLSPTDYDDREQLLGALFKILRGQIPEEEEIKS